MVFSQEIQLSPQKRGFHLITKDIIQIITNANIKNGLVHVFIKHTSASLSINENADSSVRVDFENYLNKLVPEDISYFKHTYEGSDDMPAHIKSSLIGCFVSFPLINGHPALGTWQGIYLGEHRDNGGSRKIIITIIGE